MKTIGYKIEFFSYWHCGSGLAAGADVDLLVIKDKDNMPFVPGKTIKGLVREAVETLLQLQGKDDALNKEIRKSFGYFDDKEFKQQGCMFFTNAELSQEERYAIIQNHATEFLYKSLSSTAIDNEGIAQEHSLRKMEVTVPCTLRAKILEVPDELAFIIKEGMGLIKRMGQNRNRGLGRCNFTIIEEGGNQ